VKLKKLQHHFFRALEKPSVAKDFVRQVKGSPPFSPTDRFAVYSRGYWLRLQEAIDVDFPVTRQLIGEKKFDQLTRAYIEKYKSRYVSLTDIACKFPKFLRSKKLSILICDMADLEWALIEAYYAPEIQNKIKEQLHLFATESAGKLVLDVDPAVEIITTQHDLKQIYEMKRPKALKGKSKARQYFAVYRQSGIEKFCRISVDEMKVLKAVKKRAPLEKILNLRLSTEFSWQESFQKFVEREILASISRLP